jgi:hypothetical protein
MSLEEDNADLRAAVAARTACCTETPPAEPAVPVDWILRGEAELKARREAAVAGWKDVVTPAEPARLERANLRPGSAEFLGVLDEVRSLHLRKTLDYGVDEDALSNIRTSADYVNVPAWAGCIIRMADKMHRLRAFFRRGRVEFDGVEDTLLDICAYAAIALVLYRESRRP